MRGGDGTLVRELAAAGEETFDPFEPTRQVNAGVDAAAADSRFAAVQGGVSVLSRGGPSRGYLCS